MIIVLENPWHVTATLVAFHQYGPVPIWSFTNMTLYQYQPVSTWTCILYTVQYLGLRSVNVSNLLAGEGWTLTTGQWTTGRRTLGTDSPHPSNCTVVYSIITSVCSDNVTCGSGGMSKPQGHMKIVIVQGHMMIVIVRLTVDN